MPDHTEHYRFREELVTRLRADLLGPSGEKAGSEEILNDWPMTAYAIGVLHPQIVETERARAEAAEEDYDDADSTLTVDETPDTGVVLANLRKPSATGLTFAVDTEVSDTIEIRAEAAVYEAVDRDGNPVQAVRAERRTTDEQGRRWRRHPLDLRPVSVNVMEGTPGPIPWPPAWSCVSASARRCAPGRWSPSRRLWSTPIASVSTNSRIPTASSRSDCASRPRGARGPSWSARPRAVSTTRCVSTGFSTGTPRPSPPDTAARPTGTGRPRRRGT
ncbi:hypothetical protein [Streptomyces sp. MNU89]|uniref:hypothetical protein n=1 Tax=Streptomyces sp. MNU89 TaxID=2560025 RepID=UPI0027DEB704|nr:hypothetical protein [Streptomyces sp. MNU89]